MIGAAKNSLAAPKGLIMKKYTKATLIIATAFIVTYSFVAIFFDNFRSIYYDIKQEDIVEWNGVKIIRHHGMYYRKHNGIIGVHFVGEEWKGGAFVKIEPKFDNKGFIRYSFNTNKEYNIASMNDVMFKGIDAIHVVQNYNNGEDVIDSYVIPDKQLVIGIAAKNNYCDEFKKIIDEIQLSNWSYNVYRNSIPWH